MDGHDFREGVRLGYMLAAGENLCEALLELINVMQGPAASPEITTKALGVARWAVDQWRVSRERQGLSPDP